MSITYNRKRVFNGVRAVFSAPLTQSQVDGIEAILGGWERDYPLGDTRWLAYALATAHWETGQKMQPISEYGSAAYFARMYDIRGARPAVARALGNTQPGDGARFHGRGLAQTTGRTNYGWASTVLGVDCIANPDELLKPAGAVKLLFVAMIGGHYTGKKFADYLGVKTDWIGARRIINGADKAETIAATAVKIFAVLKAAALAPDAAPKTIALAAAPAPVAALAPASAAPKPGLFSRIRYFFGRH